MLSKNMNELTKKIKIQTFLHNGCLTLAHKRTRSERGSPSGSEDPSISLIDKLIPEYNIPSLPSNKFKFHEANIDESLAATAAQENATSSSIVNVRNSIPIIIL